MKKKLFSTLFAFALLCACSEVDPNDCSMAVCSEQNNTIRLSIAYSDNTPVALDTFKLVNMLDKSAITIDFSTEEWTAMQTKGLYFLSDDRFVAGHENTQTVIEFTGFIASEEVVKRAITLSIDCCHVSPFYGDLKVVLSNHSANLQNP